MSLLLRSLVALGLAVSPSFGRGAITYVDADANFGAGAGNTTIDGAVVNTTVPGNNATTSAAQGSLSNGLWHIRTNATVFNLGVDGVRDVWEAGSSTETVSPLVTTISLPAAGTYNLYGYFWNNPLAMVLNTGSWDCGFSTDGGTNYVIFDRENASLLDVPDADGLHNSVDFSAPVMVRSAAGTGNSLALLEASLGQVTVAAAGTFDVYIQSPVGTLTGDNRTLYEGIGYELAPPSLVPGDFDGDGDVDGADFVVWQTNFPKAEGGTLDTGDADADGDVDGADFVVWQTNFPTTPGPGASPIPEPQSILLVMIGTPLMFGGWRCRGRR